VRFGNCRSIAFLACILATTQAQSVEFEQLRFGMTLEEVQALTPGIEWNYIPSASGDRPAEEIEAPDIVSLAGLLFTAKIYHGPDNRHRMTFLRAEPAPNAAACKAQGIALITDLETKVGSFQWPGKQTTGEHLIRVGVGSTAEVTGVSSSPARQPARKHVQDIKTTAFGLRSRKSVGTGPNHIEMDVIADFKQRHCVLEFTLQRGMR
jgi:hypothetical protein